MVDTYLEDCLGLEDGKTDPYSGHERGDIYKKDVYELGNLLLPYLTCGGLNTQTRKMADLDPNGESVSRQKLRGLCVKSMVCGERRNRYNWLQLDRELM